MSFKTLNFRFGFHAMVSAIEMPKGFESAGGYQLKA
jgi:hypothetical protein